MILLLLTSGEIVFVTLDQSVPMPTQAMTVHVQIVEWPVEHAGEWAAETGAEFGASAAAEFLAAPGTEWPSSDTTEWPIPA
ncbi:MAG: hypothetical protein ACRDH7_09275 [Actinomycetota bacterium]